MHRAAAAAIDRHDCCCTAPRQPGSPVAARRPACGPQQQGVHNMLCHPWTCGDSKACSASCFGRSTPDMTMMASGALHCLQTAELAGSSIRAPVHGGRRVAHRQQSHVLPTASASNGTAAGAGTRVVVIGEAARPGSFIHTVCTRYACHDILPRTLHSAVLCSCRRRWVLRLGHCAAPFRTRLSGQQAFGTPCTAGACAATRIRERLSKEGAGVRPDMSQIPWGN